MELMVFVVALIVLDLLALHFGANSGDSCPNWP